MRKDKDWIYATNVYEVNLRQYTEEGSFRAFSAHLPRLKDMGVKTLWFMPLTPISAAGRKGTMGSYYACAHYTAINPEFGTAEECRALFRRARDMGFTILIDWVANHTGWDHEWTRTHPEWYLKDPQTGDFLKASGMDDIIELDFSQPDMRRAMIEAMRYWVQHYDIDGFRCDLASWVELPFWEEAIPELNREKPLFWLAEADVLESPAYMQYFDAYYTWKWMHDSAAFCRGERSFHDLLQVLHQYRLSPALPAWFTSNHDENSWNGTEYEKYGGLAPLLAVFSCTFPGIPLLYSGQEIPNRKRLQFFDKDPIDWDAEITLHEFYKTLLNLHASHPALRANVPFERMYNGADNQVLAYRREAEGAVILVLLNFSASAAYVHLREDGVRGKLTNVFGGTPFTISGAVSFTIPPYGYLLFES